MGSISKGGALAVAAGNQFTADHAAGDIGQSPGTGNVSDKGAAGIALNRIGGNSTAITGSQALSRDDGAAAIRQGLDAQLFGRSGADGKGSAGRAAQS